MNVVLISTYELGHQPFGLASPAAWLRARGDQVTCLDLSREALREDAIRDCWGQYCYIRDLDDDSIWSAGRQPAGCCADEYQAELRPDRGVLRRRDGDIETLYEVAVVPDADAEVHPRANRRSIEAMAIRRRAAR